MTEQPSRAILFVNRVWKSKLFEWILTVILMVAVFASGIILEKSLSAADQRDEVQALEQALQEAESADYPTFSPARGDTDPVLSLQIISEGKPVDHQCTAALIKPRWAVTAAHCVDPVPPNVDPTPPDVAQRCGSRPKSADQQLDPATMPMTVRGGTKNYARGGEKAKVVSIHTEPRWSWKNLNGTLPYHDVALLELDQAMALTPATIGSVPEGEAWGLVTGWGTRPDGCGEIQPRMGQWALAVTSCRDRNAFEVCATTGGAVGPCSGTSGGPLFTLGTSSGIGSGGGGGAGQPRVIVGVYSHAWGDYCGQSPNAFTILSQYTDFITTTTGP